MGLNGIGNGNSHVDYSQKELKAQKKAEKKLNRKASIAAMNVSSLASTATLPASIGIIEKMAGMQKNITPEQTKLMNDAGEKILRQTGLAAKNVNIENCDSFISIGNKAMNKLAEYTLPMAGIASGKNAAFNPAVNSVLVNKEKAAALQFHELGHAFNYNNSKAWKIIQGMRTPAMALAGAIAMYGAFSKNYEATDGKELTKAQKASNFVRNNSGKLAFGAMIPVLMEEGMASIRGCKWASQLLPKDLSAHVAKTNKTAYLSYVLAAVGMGVAATVATKAKDYFVEKNKEKQQKTQKM